MTPELHPLTQKYPPMEADEFAAFRADLAAHGQKNPIWLFEGKVLDGRNRLRACLELGIEPKFAKFSGTEAEAAAFVDSQNLHRRHLSREWRQQRVREMRDHGMSYRAIAQELGTSAMTILRDASSGVTNVTPEHSAQDSGVTFVTPEQSASNSREFADPSEATPTHRHPPIPVGEPARVNQSSVPPSATTESPRIRGRDGKSYCAERPPASKPKPAPKENAQWSELASVLTELAQKVETLVPTPAENERPWELISSLEATARSLLRQAERLKRRHHL